MAALAERAPSAAEADSAAQPRDAAFVEAVKMFKSGDSTGALPLFRRLGETTGSPNVQLYIGYCQLDLKHPLAAHQAFALAVKLALDSGDMKYDDTKEAALAEIGKLSLRLASLTISFVGSAGDFAVRLDGQPVAHALLGSPIVVEPGVHRVEAEGTDLQPIVRTETLVGGEFKTVTLVFEKAVRRGVDLAARGGPAPEEQAASAARWKIGGLVAGGVGLVGIGTFAVAGLKARSTYNRLQTECPLGCSDATHRGEAADGQTYQTVANAGLVLGIAGALMGAGLLYWGFGKSRTANPSVEVSLGSVRLSLTGTF
jgi:hypothetical protein